MRWTLALTALVFVLVSIPQGALAGCVPTTSTPNVTITSGALTYYIVLKGCSSGICPAGEYVYQETNNVAGLQRSDMLRDDTCGDPQLGDLQLW